jgi:hypothetical protein
MANKIKPYDEYEDNYKDVYEEETPAQRARNYATNAMSQAGSFNLPAPPVPSKNINQYDINTDYTAKMNDAIARGDYGAAKEYERLHNVKNGDLGLGYANSGIFNYLDTKGLGDLKEGKRQELDNYINQGFSYNYEDDPEYKAIRRLKEKEANKAYKDGYAQMSAAFDGDIPVNMINKLISSKNEIVDQADEYIPQLRQMAYNMYMDKGNNLYNQYNMLASEEAADYNRWLADRDMFIQGNENVYGREWNKEEREYLRGRDKILDDRYTEETNWNRDYMINDRDWNREQMTKEFDYKKSYDDWYKDFMKDQLEKDEKYRWAALNK